MKPPTLPRISPGADFRPFGAAMRRMRESAGFSQAEVARFMGISTGYLCDLEHGRKTWYSGQRDDYLKALKQKA